MAARHPVIRYAALPAINTPCCQVTRLWLQFFYIIRSSSALSTFRNIFNVKYSKLNHSIELVMLILTHIIFLYTGEFESVLRAFKVDSESDDGDQSPGGWVDSDTPIYRTFSHWSEIWNEKFQRFLCGPRITRIGYEESWNKNLPSVNLIEIIVD